MGETGVAFKDFSGKGKVMIHGEIWNALSDEELKKDDPIVVIEAQGMVVTVKKHTS